MCVIMPDYDAVFVINSGYDNNRLSYVLESFYEHIMFNMKPETIQEDKESQKKLEDVLANLNTIFKFSEMSPLARIIDGNTYEIAQKGIYKAVKLNFNKDEVIVTLISDEKNFQFTAGFKKAVYGKAVGTNFAPIASFDSYETVATAIWNSKKYLEITLRLIGTPAIVKVIADFSKEPSVKLDTVRCNF